VAIDVQGAMVAIGDSRGTVRLFEVASGEELLSYAVTDREIRSLAFSPDGERLLISDGREPLRIWHWAEGDMPDQFGAHPHPPVAFEWSHDGALVAVAHYGAEGVHILDGETAAMLAKVAQGPFFDAVRFIAFSPEDQLLATCDQGTAAVAFWDVESGQLVRSVGQGALRAGRIAFSPDGRQLAKYKSHPALIHTWDVATGKPSAFVDVGHQDHPWAIFFFPGDQEIATAGDDGTLRIWDVETGKQLRTCAHRPDDTGESRVTVWIRAMDVSPDGRLVATSSQDNTDRIWGARTGAEVHRLPGHGRTGGRRAARFSQDGQQLMTWGDDMSIRVWDVNTGKLLVEHPVRPSGVDIPEDENGEVDFDTGDWNVMLDHGVFSPDASHFLLGYGSRDYYLYDVNSGEEISRITLDQSIIHSAAIAPNCKLLLLGGLGRRRNISLASGGAHLRLDDEFEVSLRRLPGGEPIAAWKLPGRMAGPVVFGPGGDVFAVASSKEGEPIRVYKTDGAMLLAEIDGFDAIPYSLAFSHDGRHLASGFSDTSALVWDWRQFAGEDCDAP
jgi:WD40 repeat protein